MKTKEELNELRTEFESLNAKLAELSDEELKTVAGGIAPLLPADTLHEGAYAGMFNGCPGLDIAPDLPAQNLPFGAYKPDEAPEGYK